MQIISDVTSAITDLIKLHRLNNWANLLFRISLSGTISFLVLGGLAMGGAAASQKIPAALCFVMGLSAGMVGAGVFMTVTFRGDPLTKGMLMFLPSAEALEELHVDKQIIQRSK